MLKVCCEYDLLWQRKNDRNMLAAFRYLTKKGNPLNLYIFRLFFGIVSALQFKTFWEIIPKYSIPPYRLTYDFFHWVQPVNESVANIVYPVLIIASILFSLGVLYRINALLVFLGFSYCFLVDKTIYNNHYYLFILISFLFLLSPISESVLKRRLAFKPLPFAWLFLFQFQICVAYFFGGVNKLNYDWIIHAEPIYTWLPDLFAEHNISISGKPQLYLAYFLSYAGLLADLFMGIFLFINTRYRKYAIALAIIFNLQNAFLFNIGYFPWFGLLALVLFVKPLSSYFQNLSFLNRIEDTTQKKEYSKPLVLYFFIFWVVFQMLFPLRHWLIPGWYLWDERAMFFSWTMKLRDKEPIVSISVDDTKTRKRYSLNPGNFVIKRQLKYLAYRPVDMVHFAHYLKDYYKDSLKMDVAIYAEVFVNLNHYRKPQLIINPYIDLSKIEINPFYIDKYSWIVPLGEDKSGLEPPNPLR